MEERPVAPSEIQSPRKLVCRHCGAVNPPKAYCCITCFKILRPKAQTPLWQMAMRPSVSIIIVLILILIVGLVAMKRWIGAVEARVQMDLKSSDYHISVVADKKNRPADGVAPGEAAAPETTDGDEAPAEAPVAAPPAP